MDNISDTLKEVARGNSAVIMKKLNSMIAQNVLIIVMLIAILAGLLYGLYYFVSSLINTLSVYRTAIKNSQALKSASESLADRAADNEFYPEPKDPNDDSIGELGDARTMVDPAKFMPKNKRAFIKNLEANNTDYNKQKTDLMTRRLNYPENDDLVNSKVLYKDYDDYQYDYDDKDNDD